jgi:hypothetical protein
MAARAGDADAVQDGDGQGQQDQALSDRVSTLETGQETLSGKLDQVIGMLGGKGGGGHADDPTAAADSTGNAGNIAHEIRAQLDKVAREKEAAAKEGERDGTLAELRAKVAELTEKTPEPMPRRVEKIMGWS